MGVARVDGKEPELSDDLVGEEGGGDAIVGKRIRYYRMQRQLTLSELAARSGISTSFLGQVERGVANPSVLTLRRISSALSVPILYLFVDHDRIPGAVRRRYDRHAVRQDRSHVERELITPDIARRIVLALVRYDGNMPEPEGESSHAHEECLLVTRGTVRCKLGEHEVTLAEGDSIYFDARTPHAVWNDQQEPAELLSCMAPIDPSTVMADLPLQLQARVGADALS